MAVDGSAGSSLPPWKQNWLDTAEVLDALRIFPRIIICAYAWWMYRVTGWIVLWYENLHAADRTAEVTAFVTIVLPGIFGLAVWVYKIYAIGGRSWGALPQDEKNAP